MESKDLNTAENGSIHISTDNSELVFDPQEYCLDHFNGAPGVLVCVKKDTVNEYKSELLGGRSTVTFSFVENGTSCDGGCIRKCCPRNYILQERTCTYNNRTKFAPKVYWGNVVSTRNLSLNVHSANSCSTQERRFVTNIFDENIYLQENGYLLREIKNHNRRYVYWTKYCLETRQLSSDSFLVGFVCVSKTQVSLDEECVGWLSVGMIISMPFLLVTFVVYALLPDRNLHQKALMFYVLTLLIAYILLVTINLSSSFQQPWCSVIAYVTIFSFMSSFFWMNVICFDIWYTFSGGRGFVGSKRSTERRRLIYYSLYALGGPLLILGLIGLMQNVLPPSSYHNPNIGVSKCFLADGWANLWYFYLEAGILVLINVIFFTFTALKIRKVKKETSMLKHNDSQRHSYEKDKQKFNLYVKLLFAMGVNWSMEVISWAVNWRTDNNVKYIWYATDFFNAVYGVFIFFIFVFKKKIWTLLQKRYYNFIGKPHLAHTVVSNQTRTSHYSSTNYSTADTQLTGTNGRPPSEEMGLRTLP